MANVYKKNFGIVYKDVVFVSPLFLTIPIPENDVEWNSQPNSSLAVAA